MVIYRYPLIIFDSDYITNSLDRLDRPETRRIQPFKNSHFARFDSLTHDYFADRDRLTLFGAFSRTYLRVKVRLSSNWPKNSIFAVKYFLVRHILLLDAIV